MTSAPATADSAAAEPARPEPDRWRSGRPVPPLPADLKRSLVVKETWLVFAISLGASGLSALISYIGDLTARRSLHNQVALLNGSYAPGRPWLDLAFQLFNTAQGVVPVLLVWYLLARSGSGLRDIGVDRSRPWPDLARGAGLAAVVGGTGLGLYLAAYHSGINLTVVPEDLPAVWWRAPVLVLSALQNGLIEEVLVVGYLLTRLRQLGWGDNRALATSAVLRGSYHLYQGLGGFAANAVMGLLFGWLYQRRWGRAAPLVVAHTLIDAVAFLGYAALAGKVGWLPTPHK